MALLHSSYAKLKLYRKHSGNETGKEVQKGRGSFRKILPTKGFKKSLILNRSILRNMQLVNKIFGLIQINLSMHYLFSTFGQYPYIIICMCIRHKLHPHDARKKH